MPPVSLPIYWDHTDPQWVNDPYPILAGAAPALPGRAPERYGGLFATMPASRRWPTTR